MPYMGSSPVVNRAMRMPVSLSRRGRGAPGPGRCAVRGALSPQVTMPAPSSSSGALLSVMVEGSIAFEGPVRAPISSGEDRKSVGEGKRGGQRGGGSREKNKVWLQQLQADSVHVG